ncbi:hypothetical protein NQ317_006070 [Molorchus minor]|uniref:Uncharacterized protein n=1 Tax=Molorchus minor TaxID=1323400 RepID=A0ABQ9K4S6_9CUCU|nr:hypothetical protein NQ317_006070 [Molorchus minor]
MVRSVIDVTSPHRYENTLVKITIPLSRKSHQMLATRAESQGIDENRKLAASASTVLNNRNIEIHVEANIANRGPSGSNSSRVYYFDTGLFGIVKQEASAALVIDYLHNRAATINCQSGYAIIVDFDRRALDRYPSNTSWIIQNFEEVFGQRVTSLESYGQPGPDAVSSGFDSVDPVTENDLRSFTARFFGDSVTLDEAATTVEEFMAQFNRRLKYLYRGRGAFTVNKPLTWFFRINAALFNVMDGAEVLGTVEPLDLALIFGGSTSEEALSSLYTQISNRVDPSSIFREMFSSLENFLQMNKQLKIDNDGIDGLIKIVLNTIQLAIGNGTIRDLVDSVLVYVPDPSLTYEQIGRLNNVTFNRFNSTNPTVRLVERITGGIASRNLTIGGIDIAEVINMLMFKSPKQVIQSAIRIISQLLSPQNVIDFIALMIWEGLSGYLSMFIPLFTNVSQVFMEIPAVQQFTNGPEATCFRERISAAVSDFRNLVDGLMQVATILTSPTTLPDVCRPVEGQPVIHSAGAPTVAQPLEDRVLLSDQTFETQSYDKFIKLLLLHKKFTARKQALQQNAVCAIRFTKTRKQSPTARSGLTIRFNVVCCIRDYNIRKKSIGILYDFLKAGNNHDKGLKGSPKKSTSHGPNQKVVDQGQTSYHHLHRVQDEGSTLKIHYFDTGLIGVVNVTAPALLIIDYNNNMIETINGNSGDSIVFNFNTKTADYYRENEAWVIPNIEEVLRTNISSLNEPVPGAVTTTFSDPDPSFVTEGMFVMKSLFCGEVDQGDLNHIFTTFFSDVNKNLRCLYRGNGSIVLHHCLGWFFDLNHAFSDILDGADILCDSPPLDLGTIFWSFKCRGCFDRPFRASI